MTSLHSPKKKPEKSNTSLSKAVDNISQKLVSKDNSQVDFNSIYDNFQIIDKNEPGENHIWRIIDNSKVSIQQYKLMDNVDTYFYILYKLEKYAKKCTSSHGQIDILRTLIIEELQRVFSNTEGMKPNCTVQNESKLEQINYLSYIISNYDYTGRVELYLAFCKLSFQSKVFTNKEFTWMELLKQIEYLLQKGKIQLIDKYVRYYKAFKSFPIDKSTFRYLIDIEKPKLSYLQHYLKELDMNTYEFYYDFLKSFCKNVRNQYYSINEIAEFLYYLTAYEDSCKLYCEETFKYIQNLENISTMLVLLSNLPAKFIKYLVKYACIRLKSSSVHVFKTFFDQIIKHESKSLHKMLEKIFEVFVSSKLDNTNFNALLQVNESKTLLEIAVQISLSTDKSYMLLIIRRLLQSCSSLNTSVDIRITKLFELFADINASCCQLDPSKIVGDEWLINFVPRWPNDWIKLTQYTYQHLIIISKNNVWIIYIWEQLIRHSLFDSHSNNSEKSLESFDTWLFKTKIHPDANNDQLSLSLVSTVFYAGLPYLKNSTLPKIENTIKYLINAKQEMKYLTMLVEMNMKTFDTFSLSYCQIREEILSLNGNRSAYEEFTLPENIRILTLFNSSLFTGKKEVFEFPRIHQSLISFIPHLEKPKDIRLTDDLDIIVRRSCDWLKWFDSFINVFFPIVEWLATHQVQHADEVLQSIKRSQDINARLALLKETVVKISFLIEPLINHIHRLCCLFNCLTPITIVNAGITSRSADEFIKEMKRFGSNKVIEVSRQKSAQNFITIEDRQVVQWTLACEKSNCDVHVVYSTTKGYYKDIYKEKQATIDKNVLSGRLEVNESGILSLYIDNTQCYTSNSLWYSVRTLNLTPGYLFEGIFKDVLNKCSDTELTSSDVNRVLTHVFNYVDDLINGNISLSNLSKIQSSFYNDIDIDNEVYKLATSRSEHLDLDYQQQISKVCKYLKIYQYYSFIPTVLKCISTFHIVNENDLYINDLKTLIGEKTNSLKDISTLNKNLKDTFTGLENSHLELIKTTIDCAPLILLFKKYDLYSRDGQRRFFELKDTLTTQFQLQARNNLTLNALIITYTLCEPFCIRTTSLEEFIFRLRQLTNIDESLAYLNVCYMNIQTINTWLSTDASTLENAVITMEHLYKTGVVHVHLRQLLGDNSYFEITYHIKKTSKNDDMERDNICCKMSMLDFADHKRQLTFSNVDLVDMSSKKVMLVEQLELLKIIEKIYTLLQKLENLGHPHYQAIVKQYNIDDEPGKLSSILDSLKVIYMDKSQQYTDDDSTDYANQKQEELKIYVENCTRKVESYCISLDHAVNDWIHLLDEYRMSHILLNFYSNRQIMIMLILLTPNITRRQFLSKLYINHSWNQNEPQLTQQENELIFECLNHYLQSVRICESVNLSGSRNITKLIQQNQTDVSTKTCLTNLCVFLAGALSYNKQKPNHYNTITTSTNVSSVTKEQYLIKLNTHDVCSSSFDQTMDEETISTILNVFNNNFPCAFQILSGSTASEEDIVLFFKKIRIFVSETFIALDIDNMHHRLREILLTKQNELSKTMEPHAKVYYFSRHLIAQKGMKPWFIVQCSQTETLRSQMMSTYAHANIVRPSITVVTGKSGTVAS
ncbi:unnamed protein product [Didymodactylos carnosus]|uniref:Uncharacterized protein n=1 Tax=Didymodactylos carnosus TaxID=1234261 RepID=A0A814ZIL3_9BILA|nr:unnamed protein product [Didymodactylos carnosus]CAF4009549.1 unnamed protein product [Didymodactylos carnosus]